MELRYAAAESRPVKIIINGKLANSDAAGKVTGSWNPDSQTWEAAGLSRLDIGTNRVRIERADCIPHIDKLLFAPVAESEAEKVPGLSGAIPETSRLIPEFVAQWTKYLEKTERATNSVLSVWHEFLASWKLREAEGTKANERKTDSPAASVLFRAGAPNSLAELAGRYAEQFSQAEQADLLKAVEYLDRKMREIRDAGKVIGVERIAITAALNLTHELLTMRLGGFDVGEFKRRMQSMTATIDAALAAQNELF
jgi:cell division protein ZapA